MCQQGRLRLPPKDGAEAVKELTENSAERGAMHTPKFIPKLATRFLEEVDELERVFARQ